MKVWLIFFILLNILGLYNQERCSETEYTTAQFFSNINNFCSLAKVDAGFQCVIKMSDDNVVLCGSEECDQCEGSPILDISCNYLSQEDNFNYELNKYLNSQCRIREVSDGSICTYDIDNLKCVEINSCESMPTDKCNEFPVSDHTKICKLKSDQRQCEIVERPNKKNKASFINRMSLFINIFILLL